MKSLPYISDTNKNERDTHNILLLILLPALIKSLQQIFISLLFCGLSPYIITRRTKAVQNLFVIDITASKIIKTIHNHSTTNNTKTKKTCGHSPQVSISLKSLQKLLSNRSLSSSISYSRVSYYRISISYSCD